MIPRAAVRPDNFDAENFDAENFDMVFLFPVIGLGCGDPAASPNLSAGRGDQWTLVVRRRS
jgi:hypothetical protein